MKTSHKYFQIFFWLTKQQLEKKEVKALETQKNLKEQNTPLMNGTSLIGLKTIW